MSVPEIPLNGSSVALEPSASILERFERLHPKEIDLSLDRVFRLLQTLNNPHEELQGVVHVAGTNGKGSVIAFMRSMLESAGKRVHVFTSPHLVNFHERIVLGGEGGGLQIPEQLLSECLLRVEAANAGAPITFFEITAVAALLAFAETPSDYVLLETGLGGRLDATNVIASPALTVITPVSHDHERFLGNDLKGIAAEKAGIMKHGVPCILARQEPETMAVFEDKANTLDAPLIAQGVSWDAFDQHGRLVFQTASSLLDLPLPNLAGHHQIDNAGTALAAIRALGDKTISDKSIELGLTSAHWPARLQNLSGSRLQDLAPNGSEIWLDGGHNQSAARVLAHAIAEMEERQPMPLHLICGMMAAKDAARFFEQFTTLAQWAGTLAIPGQENALGAQDLALAARTAGLASEAFSDLAAAFAASKARAAGPVRILVCGSLYFAGHILSVLQEKSPGA